MKIVNEPILKKPADDLGFFVGVLNLTWLSLALWGVGYLVFRYMTTADEVVAEIARKAGM